MQLIWKGSGIMIYLKAFLVGGLICGLIQILMDRTKLLPGRIMVLLVCLGIAAGVLGLYKPLVDFAGGRSYRSPQRVWLQPVGRCERSCQ